MRVCKWVIFSSLLFILVSEVDAAVDTQVSAVTVYRQGAQITRSADLNLQAGEQQIELLGFPADVNINTIRLELSDASVKLGQVVLKSVPLREAPDQEIQRLEREILAKEIDIRAVEDQNKSAKLQLKFLESLAAGYAKDAWAGAANANADTASWQRALTLMDTGSQKAYKTLRDNVVLLDELNKDLDLLNEKLNAQNSRLNLRKRLLVSLQSDSAKSVSLKANYLHYQAGWQPRYEARLDTRTNSLVLAQKAQVWQASQEPWQNISLSLASSQPSQSLQPPELSSEFYTLVDPTRRYAARAQSNDALEEVVVTASKVGSPPTTLADALEEPPIWQGDFSQTFRVPGRITVSNNRDQVQSYDLQTYSFDVDLVTQVAPMFDEQAYLSARFVSDNEQPIYGSQMQVFVDGVMMGTSTMPTILPGERTVLPMGVDQQIDVRVVDQGGKGGEGGVISKSKSRKVNLKFEVSNRRADDTRLEVRAIYPQSRDRSLRVKINADATKPSIENEDGKVGVMVWEKVLAGGATWAIDYGYSMTYPAGKNLNRQY